VATGLDFAGSWDIQAFRRKCAKQRKLATRYPAYDKNMAFVEEYRWRMGPWSLCFQLESWRQPAVWHGSAAVMEQIGYETLDLEGRIEVPQDALLATSSWSPEHFEQARYILATIFGPLIRPGDDHQDALESTGLWALHVHLKYEGEPRILH
jgi:hypothetical protein